MLKTTLLQPEILEALGGAGHGAKVLIADGNFPFSTKGRPAAKHVYLNLAPGMLTVTDILKVLVTAIPIEAAEVMQPPTGEPPIFAEFREILGMELKPLGRFEFYDAASSNDVALVIASGEQRIYANLLLTIGVVMP
ncbi:MAG: RbsD/FucU family protein [Thermoflexales bacterium]|nr:RbsD/FucU family protein [Thermoflexales bacterium]